jgi:hypothetical protein
MAPTWKTLLNGKLTHHPDGPSTWPYARQFREGKIPKREMMKLTARKGMMFGCAEFDPTLERAAGFIVLFALVDEN